MTNFFQIYTSFNYEPGCPAVVADYPKAAAQFPRNEGLRLLEPREKITDLETIKIKFVYDTKDGKEDTRMVEFHNRHGFTRRTLYKAIFEGYSGISSLAALDVSLDGLMIIEVTEDKPGEFSLKVE